MFRTHRMWPATSLLTLLLALDSSAVVQAQVAAVPSLMNFQGRMAKPDGTPVPDGTYSVTFRFYNAVMGGTLLASQTVSPVTVRNGIFAVNLTAMTTATFANDVWLEIQIGANSPLTPRQKFATVANAFKADSVKDGAITGASIANGTITANKFAANIFNTTAWLLGGNSGTNPSTQYLGTSDNTALSLRTNGTERLFVGASGFVGVGRSYQVTGAEYFEIGTPNKSGFGGMYIRNNGVNSLPFYGYSRNGGVDAYHFVDSANTWRLVTAPGTVLTIQPSGDANFNGVNVIAGSPDNAVAGGVYGATVFGGDVYGSPEPNVVNCHGGTVSGGAFNNAGGTGVAVDANRYATVGGGLGNIAQAPAATVSGGTSNIAGTGWYATAGGGYNNQATGFWSVIPGGGNNVASAYYSFAAGQNAKALHNGTFVWANGNSDFSGTDFASTAPGQFLIRAPGGVGIGTNNPLTALHIPDRGLQIGQSPTASDNFHFAADTYGGPRALRLYTGNYGAGVWHTTFMSNGNVGIGKSDPQFKLDVNGAIWSTNFIQGSDVRYKTHIATFDNALDAILELRGVTFEWKKGDFPKYQFPEGRQVGFIAQEVEKVLPELVTTDANGYKSVAYANVVPVLVEAVKTLKAQRDTDRAELNALKAQVREMDTLKAQLSALAARLSQMETEKAVRK